ncbi:MAG TPA: phosphatase domain-containing protein [Propionibacteriaceae bacterium]|nr:phosphatase domain-containing protein [Propionibacteriaceae bacterium]
MSNRPFVGARMEEFVYRRVNRVLRRMGWTEVVLPFTGYGTQSQVRVLARVVLRPAEPRTPLGKAAEEMLLQRGWRNFVAAPIPHTEVSVTVGSSGITLRTDRNGYVDVRVKSETLTPGWNHVTITTPTSLPTDAPVMVVDDSQTFGLVSDIDDTVISTFLPRLFIAAWNSLVLTEQARQPVPGMAQMLTRLLADHPGAPIIYVSTGAWNTFSVLNRFLQRHGFPVGPMLLTDWGPTNTGWFRSGTDHKSRALRELARDFPTIRWVLIGDDGQHDPMLYSEFAELQPEHVRAIAIRELTMAEQVLAHGTATVLQDADAVQWTPESAPEVRGPDGTALLPQLQQVLAETDEVVGAR